MIRPPYGAGSVMLEVTVGCTHNSCAFCIYYKGHLPPRAAQAVRADLAEIARFSPGADHIWAASGDPFSTSTRRLLELARRGNGRALVAALENPAVIDTRLVTNSIGFVAELPADREECQTALDRTVAGFSGNDERGHSRRGAMMRTV